MDKTLRLSFGKGDWIAVAAVILLAVGTLLAYLPAAEKTPGGCVQVYRDSVLVDEVPLNEDRVFQVTGEYINEVTIQNGRVSVTHSTCPGTDCVRMAPVSAPGRTIVCLPNRVELRVVDGDGRIEDDVDFVVR